MNKKAEGGWIVFIVIIVILAVIGFFMSFAQVPAGYVGVKDNMGQIDEAIMQPGFYTVGPFIHVHDMSVRVQKEVASCSAASKDLQDVTTAVTVNYRIIPEKAPELYKTVGENYADVVMAPVIQEAVKASTAKYSAEQLVQNRAAVKQDITDQVTTKLSANNIIVTEVSITDFSFGQEFTQAIESKQVAEQTALKAVKDKEAAITRAEAASQSAKLEADGQAYAIKAKADADAYALDVVRQQLSQSTQLLEYNAIKQWNGQLPTYMTSSQGMFFNLPLESTK